ncbi:MAG: organomercurial lyase [Gammaproteobacteria bacterium]|jgi:hypothetical protein
MKLEDALARLTGQLPLKPRQQRLAPELQTMHRSILWSLATTGKSAGRDELQQICGSRDVFACLQELGANDLIVLDPQTGLPVGAYPLTIESTPHRISMNGQHLYAMCALDAVSVAPLFQADVRIDSTCHVSHTPIRIRMQSENIIEQESDMDAIVGIRWQMPGPVAAHSMCMQMVFLQDYDTALAWQAGDEPEVTLFSLPDAVRFGEAFFLPLLQA